MQFLIRSILHEKLFEKTERNRSTRISVKLQLFKFNERIIRNCHWTAGPNVKPKTRKHKNRITDARCELRWRRNWPPTAATFTIHTKIIRNRNWISNRRYNRSNRIANEMFFFSLFSRFAFSIELMRCVFSFLIPQYADSGIRKQFTYSQPKKQEKWETQNCIRIDHIVPHCLCILYLRAVAAIFIDKPVYANREKFQMRKIYNLNLRVAVEAVATAHQPAAAQIFIRKWLRQKRVYLSLLHPPSSPESIVISCHFLSLLSIENRI